MRQYLKWVGKWQVSCTFSSGIKWSQSNHWIASHVVRSCNFEIPVLYTLIVFDITRVKTFLNWNINLNKLLKVSVKLQIPRSNTEVNEVVNANHHVHTNRKWHKENKEAVNDIYFNQHAMWDLLLTIVGVEIIVLHWGMCKQK